MGTTPGAVGLGRQFGDGLPSDGAPIGALPSLAAKRTYLADAPAGRSMKRFVKVPSLLKVHPEFRRRAKQPCQAERRIGSEAAMAPHDSIDPLERNPHSIGQLHL